MRRTLLCVALLALLATSASAGRIADSLAFQGRLTNSSDVPVSGTQLVILSLWTDSTGGTQLHSEDQQIQFTNGLFSVCVGCVGAGLDDAIFSVSPRLWLQVQLSGEAPMSPRMLIRATPRAVTSSRVLGDIETSHNRLAIGDLNSDGRLDLVSKPDTAGISMEKVSAFKSRSGNMVILDDRASMNLKTYQPGQPSYGNITFEASDGQVSSLLDCDDDGDGQSDSRISATAGSGGGGGAGGMIILEADLDGDGVLESSAGSSASLSTVLYKATQGKSGKTKDCRMAADDDSAYTAVSMDVEADGIIDNSASSSATASTVTYKATQGKSGKAKSCKMVADEDSAYIEVSMDIGTNGVLDNSVTSSAGLTGANFTVTADADGDGVPESIIDNDCDDAEASIVVAHEAAHVVQQRAGVSLASSRVLGDLDGDGILESSVFSEIAGATASYGAKQGSTGKTKRCESSADDTSARSMTAVDLDGNGILDIQIGEVCDDGGSAERRVKSYGIGSSGQDGVDVVLRCVMDSVTEQQNVTVNGVVAQQYTAKAGKTGSTKRMICTDPSTGESVSSGEALLLDSLYSEKSFDFIDGGGQPVSMKVKEKGNRTKCTSNLRCTNSTNTVEADISCDTTTARSSWAASNAGGGDSLVIQASTTGTGNPIEHSSGAHLTSGGVWTNASDAELKENFSPVNGEEILQKVEELPISQWNYKSESEDVTHIGPTAQDFKQIFGVGVNDKTISTIDPSGIALAAIKELGRQNRELKEENQKMKELLDQLVKKVEKLSSEK